MNSSKRWVLKFFILATIVVGFSMLTTHASFAAGPSSKASIVAKALFEGVYQCAKGGAYKSWEWANGKTIRGNASATIGWPLFLQNNLSGETVKLPYQLTEVGDNNLNCGEVVMGANVGTGLANAGLIPSNIKSAANISVVNYFAGANKNGVGGIGYKAEAVGQSGGSETQTLKILPESGTFCYDKNGNRVNNSFGGLIFPAIVKSGSGKTTVYSESGSNVPPPGSGDRQFYDICGETLTVADYGSSSEISYTLSYHDPSGPVEVRVTANGGKYNYNDKINVLHYYNNQQGSQTIKLNAQVESGTVASASDTSNYKLTWQNDPMAMVKGLYNNNNFGNKYQAINWTNGSYSDLKLNGQEIYDLYTYYVTDVFKATVICDDNSNYDLYKDMEKIKWKKDKECRIDKSNAQNVGSVYGVNSGNHFVEKVDLNGVIARLNALNLRNINTDATGSLAEDGTMGGEEGVSEPGETKMTCANSGGAMSLGWIVCPILDWLGTAADDAYTKYVEPSLKVDPKLFTSNDDGMHGVRAGWETFRNIANVLFIILLLVVIFSQLTGVGIDNYGIKKILPKLIVAAVLINLSYVLCLIAVDLSNILGNGLRAMFDGLGANLKPSLDLTADGAEVGSVNDSGLGATLITGVGVLVALVGMAGVIWNNPAILLSLLVAALGVAISIFFLFILLAMREAAIVVLVAISPLAVACYMLPNTKKLFDRWLKFFQGLLLVYPICGLLIGGGNYVSKLLLSADFASGGFLQAFTAMIVGIVPIFFIPTALKGSFAAMGKVGATLTGLGERARKGATGRLRNSDRYKNLQERSADRAKFKSLQRRAGGRFDADGNFQERGLRSRFARTSLGRRLGADVAVGKARGEYVQSQNARLNAANNMQTNIANAALQEGENQRIREREKGNVGVAPLDPEHVRRELENQRIQTEVEMELQPKPKINRDFARIKMQNALNEAIAEADDDIRPFELDVDLAKQRRQSARDAQEFKAYQDQFAGMDQNQLRTMSASANTWFNASDASSQQRMRALIGAMNTNGMEKDVFDMLGSTDVSGSASVMSELANSSNKVQKAYGKKGAGQSYTDFMSNGGMQNYIADKGADFLNGLDDKALAQIKDYSNSSGNELMSTDLLVSAAAQLNGEDSMREVNAMLQNRTDLEGKISAEDLTKLNNSTMTTLFSRQSGVNALREATESMARNKPELAARLSAQRRQDLNSRFGTNL